MEFYPFDLYLDPVNLVLDLDIVKMYLDTQNDVASYGSSKVIACTDTQTDRQTYRQTDRQT